MIDDKILLVHDYPIVKNEGGPRGYYNKCIYLNEPSNVIAVNDLIGKIKKISFRKKILIRVEFLRSKLSKVKYNSILVNKFIKIPKYKFLYFHDIYSFNDVKHLITQDQIVVFQPHAPELPSIEELNNGTSKAVYNKVVKQEKAIFKRANYIVLPNSECLPIYNSLITEENKILFLQTGIKSIEDINKIPIDNSKVNLFYIGRRNEIKGFPLLLKVFKAAVEKRDDIRLFIAGAGEKINSKNIIDIGKTNLAYDWIHSMDYVISPNKSSYFDLNVLESISIGTPLIMTTTQGHSFFKNKKGIISITSDNFYKVLIDENLVNKNYKESVKKELFELYNKELSSEVFKSSLWKICNQIIIDNR